jgi:hypothetical protein
MPPGSRQLRHNFSDRYYGKWDARANLPFNGAAVRTTRRIFLANGAPFRRSQSFRNLFLFDRRVPVDSHGAGSGRNCADPVTSHRNTGCCSKPVAHFLRGLHGPLWLCREHYVFARISSKRRCTKCEREHDTCASNRRTAQATKPVFYSHALIVIPFRILGKLI